MRCPVALYLAWRETRGSGRHVLLFLGCVGVGVTALVAVATVAGSFERAIGRSARALLGADVEIRGTQPLSPPALAHLAGLEQGGVRVTRVNELNAMARDAAGRTTLVELKAVARGYPFYGRLVTEPDRPLEALLGDGRVLVDEALRGRLGLAVGARLSIGAADFTVSGVIRSEPDRSVGVFSVGPRVLMSGADLDGTGLVRPGSRVRHRYLLRLPDGANAEAFRDALAAEIADPGVRLLAYNQAQPGLRRFWDQLSMYLGLAGLVALMVGGIGVAMGVHAFLRGKLATIAVLKALGAGRRQVLAVYLVQTVGLGLFGSLVGAAVGSAVPLVISPLLAPLLPTDATVGPSVGAVASGLGMGLGVTLLFALWPLSQTRRVRPALLLRSQVEPPPSDRRSWPLLATIALGLAALALWQAGSLTVGGLFVAGLGTALGVLALAARGVVAAARRGRPATLAWRQGLANLHRPGSQATAVLVSLGLGVMLVVAVACLDGSLRRQIAEARQVSAPAFFFVDIQPDQAGPFARLVAAQAAGRAPELIPVVRARLVAVDGTPVAADATARRPERWHLTREYVLTWAAEPPARNALVAGRWWTAEEAAREPLISVEEEIAGQLGVRIGGSLTFDVVGVPVTGRVTSLRRVDWRSLGANFFVIFSPGALDGAPRTHIATARVPREGEAALQSAVVAAFPNVTAIPVRDVLERVAGVLDQVAIATRAVAAGSVLAGLVVMAGALSVTRAQRLYQSVLLRTLGASRGAVARIFAVEYVLTGVTAGALGSVLAAALSWAVLRFALGLPWTWSPAALLGGPVGAVALALLVGALGSWRLLGAPPLTVLRRE
jgi:putative ABC transport system permease protein